MNKKYLYCYNCKNYPDVIKETFNKQPVEELRKWGGDYYELVESNISDCEYTQTCGVCDATLIEK